MRFLAVLAAVLVLAPAAAAAHLVVASDRDGDFDLYLVQDTGAGLKRLTRNTVLDGSPAFSADGRRIAFSSTRAGNEEIHVMGANGRNVRRLTHHPGFDTAPAWSPDGRRIAFASTRAGGQPELYVMDADGTNVRRLTRTARHVTDTAPAWSPDGRWIVFSSDRVSAFNAELYRVRPNGTGLRRLTHTIGSDTVLGDDSMADFSPDGGRIAFTSNRDQNGEVYVMDADGGNERRLTATAGVDEFGPRWSPDGRWIVAAELTHTSPDQLVLVDAETGERRPLVRGSSADWRP
jgi:TolB protein